MDKIQVYYTNPINGKKMVAWLSESEVINLHNWLSELHSIENKLKLFFKQLYGNNSNI